MTYAETDNNLLLFFQPVTSGGICRAGNYCPEGSAVETPCTAGQYCSIDGLALPEGDCDEGYYCPLQSTSRQEVPCPTGHYCPLGSPVPVPCRNGTYAPVQRFKEEGECKLCDAGFYCNGTGLSTVSGVCDAGKIVITFTSLWANSADDKLFIFFLFFPENRVDISCKLSSLETICMKYQILFSAENNIKKYFIMLSDENFTQSAKG